MTKLFMLQMLDAVSMTEEVANWSGTSLLDVSLITIKYFLKYIENFRGMEKYHSKNKHFEIKENNE